MTTPWNLKFGAANLTVGVPGDASEIPPEAPFRLLVTGNFSGDRKDRVPLGQRKRLLIDRDNFDEVLAKLAPSVMLPGTAGGSDVPIAINSLEDFEPDRLFETLPVFDELRLLQSQLDQPSSFEQAAARIRAWGKLPATAQEAAPKPAMSGGELLSQMLGEDPGQATEPAESSEWQRFLRRIVQPQLVEKADPRKADFEKVVEEAISAQMRAILHHPKFQALEAAWRSLFLLVRQLPTDETLQIFIWDVRLNEWQADLVQADPHDSVLVREITQSGAEKPWGAVVSLETFGKGIDDLQVLGSMLLVVSRGRTPVLAAASPRLVGCPSLASDPDPREWKADPNLKAAWQMIRSLAPAKYLGLVMPRFLLRLPYGKNATETEAFAFEEMPTPEHEHYLWGSGAVLCALMLAEGFVAAGWDIGLADIRQLNGLPLHVYAEDGSTTSKPCAEVHLRETALEVLIEQGLMTLMSLRDRDGVRLARWQSAAQSQEQLAGLW
ncbi:MAG: type VI secretion system contractile sheath large subunit [Planctomycetes bacterium]|nr:type VI secretion system contractile sheath large subunit [Planctomycetota bacterium]